MTPDNIGIFRRSLTFIHLKKYLELIFIFSLEMTIIPSMYSSYDRSRSRFLVEISRSRRLTCVHRLGDGRRGGGGGIDTREVDCEAFLRLRHAANLDPRRASGGMYELMRIGFELLEEPVTYVPRLVFDTIAKLTVDGKAVRHEPSLTSIQLRST